MVSKQAAGYMELTGASNDATCRKVQGGISQELGCCNLFEPKDTHVTRFKCGSCQHVKRWLGGARE